VTPVAQFESFAGCQRELLTMPGKLCSLGGARSGGVSGQLSECQATEPDLCSERLNLPPPAHRLNNVIVHGKRRLNVTSVPVEVDRS
jgi:hypothetical protein